MSVRVRLPVPLQGYAEGRSELSVDAATVGEALGRVAEGHPRIRIHLFDGAGRLRSFVAVFLNDEDVRARGGLSASLRDGDVVTLVPSVAGGASALRRQASNAGEAAPAPPTLPSPQATEPRRPRPSRSAGAAAPHPAEGR